MASIPGPSNPNWERLIKGEHKPDIEFLGTRILLSKLTIRFSTGEGTMRDCIIELKNFLDQNLSLPKVQTDIEKMF